MNKQRRKPLTESEKKSLDRLLFTCGFGLDRSSTRSVIEWATLLYNGMVDKESARSLEKTGIKVESRSNRIILMLSNKFLTIRERDLSLDYYCKGRHYNTLLRRAGGWSRGAVRFAGTPQRATCITLRKPK